MSSIVLKPIISIEQLERDLRFSRRELFAFWQERAKEVLPIVEAVERDGDQALCLYTQKFDGCTIQDFSVPREECKKAWEKTSASFKKALVKAAENVREFHSRQKLGSTFFERGASYLGEVVRPLKRVGCYIPGGRFSYPSSVLMTVIPAQIAGVKEIAIFSPPSFEGTLRRELLASLYLLGVEEVYRVGGAQAIAAACFGTESIKPVDKIVGPGNIYVTAAKKLLQGIVGVDLLAGPSELVMVADESVPPAWVALDLLAQAEHDPQALSILLSPYEHLLLSVKKRLERELQNQPFPFAKEVPIFLYQVENMDMAFAALNALAPEHAALFTTSPLEDLGKVEHAGSIFLGSDAAVALGDYGYGPNHVLPTMRGALFSSPLSVRDFYTFSSFIFPRRPIEYAPHALLARSEGLFYHQRSLEVRQKKTGS
ncbi:MAG: histidinol dehydrogenase [Candidatus Caldatribacteriaceae bacterium]